MSMIPNQCRSKVGAWCGLCYTNLRGRTNANGHVGFRAPRCARKGLLMGVVKKRDVPTQPKSVNVDSGGGEFLARWPSVLEMLTSVQYPDGEPRRTSTITFFYEDGAAKVCLNDRDNGLTGWAAGVDALEALDALEGLLAADTVVWRAAGQAMKGRKKRV